MLKRDDPDVRAKIRKLGEKFADEWGFLASAGFIVPITDETIDHDIDQACDPDNDQSITDSTGTVALFIGATLADHGKDISQFVDYVRGYNAKIRQLVDC